MHNCHSFLNTAFIGSDLPPQWWMYHNRQPFQSHVNNVSPLLSADDSATIIHDSMNIKSGLWFPFALYETGYYLIVLNQTTIVRDWTEQDIGFLESVCNQISIALNKSASEIEALTLSLDGFRIF